MHVTRRHNSDPHRNVNDQQDHQQQSVGDGAAKIIWEHLAENRIDLFHQITRLLSLCFSFFCFLSAVQADGMWSKRVTRYQKAMLAGASSHALSMHLLVDNLPQDGGVFSMDPCHYLIYCYVLCTSQPSIVALIPLCVWAVLDLADFFFRLLNGKLSAQHHFIQLTSWILDNKNSLLQMVAYVEIFIGVVVVPWTFLSDLNFIVLAYYKYINLRYQGRYRHSRVAFRRCRMVLSSIGQQQQCPDKVREAILKVIDYVHRMAPENVPDDV